VGTLEPSHTRICPLGCGYDGASRLTLVAIDASGVSLGIAKQEGRKRARLPIKHVMSLSAYVHNAPVMGRIKT
jgi:hypothetical protein